MWKPMFLLFPVLLLAACGSAGSADDDAQVIGGPRPSERDIRSTCLDRAQTASEEVSEVGHQQSSEFVRYQRVLVEAGYTFGIGAAPYSSGFHFLVEVGPIFESVTGQSQWADPEASAAFQIEQQECMTEAGLREEDFSAVRALMLENFACVSQAVLDTESRFGAGSLDFTVPFRDYAQGQTPEGLYPFNLLAEPYRGITGNSPFTNEGAVMVFQEQARLC